MLTQFNNLSSWRKHEITIEPHETFQLNFRDTMPNIFIIQNPNKAGLKVGITSIPHKDSYEFKVDQNCTETVGRPIGTANLYLYNDSSVQVKITVFSIEKEFDPQILKNMNVTLQDASLEMDNVIGGVAEGVTLPTTNPTLEERMAMLTSSGQYANGINLASLYAKLLTMANDLTAITNGGTVDGKTNLRSILNVFNNMVSGSAVSGYTNLFNIVEQLRAITEKVDAEPSRSEDYYHNNVVNFSFTAGNDVVLHFDWLFNDGGHSTISIDDTDVLSILEGEYFSDMTFRLSAGQTIALRSDTPLWRIKYHYYAQ